MVPKYELTTNEKIVKNASGFQHTLYQIRALQTFELVNGGIVKVGDFGGWVESIKNLSHEGNCWIDEESQAMGLSAVEGNACLVSSKISGKVLVEDDVQIYASVLGDASIVSGNTLIQNSYVHGRSILGLDCQLIDSKLTNVRVKIKPGQNENKGMSYFNTVEVFSTDGCDIFADCHWIQVLLTGKDFNFYATTWFRDVKGLNLNYISVEQSFLMGYVLIHENSQIRVKGILSEESSIIGEEGESEDNWIQINSQNLLLKNSQLLGHVSIEGKWMLTTTQIMGYARIANEWSSQLMLSNSHISDAASVLAKSSHAGGSSIKTLCLHADESYIWT